MMTGDYRLPPRSIESEQSVLGAILLDAQSDRVQTVFAILSAEMFHCQPHVIIYRTVRDMNTRSQAIDLITVSERLESTGELDCVGGFAYLAELSKNTPSVANVVAYANRVKDFAIERFAIEQANKMLEVFYTPSTLSTAEKLDTMQALAMHTAEKSRTGTLRGAVPFAEAFDSWMNMVEKRLSNDPAAVGISTGIPSLDNLLAPKGLVKGSLFVVGARPKMGKTTLYMKLALHCALTENKPAIAFSLEMPQEQLVERSLSQASGVSSSHFYLDGYEDNRFALASAKGLEIAQTGNLYIDDTPGLSLAHIVAESRRIYRERGAIGMILVDYLTLMKAERAERNDLAYGLITKGLKHLAKELNCVVVLLTQLNRELERRANKRPIPSDSRDTGQIEQDCDYWLGIYRAGAYDEHANQRDTELLLRLNRHGQSGVVFVEQRHGVLYDCDQHHARARMAEAERRSSKQSGGF